MKIAIIGSRNITKIPLELYMPDDVDEIISGGAKGVDSYAAEYAKNNNIKLTVILPEYKKYSRYAPLLRNKRIVEAADKIIAFWDGKSKGTLFVINYAKEVGKDCEVILFN